jgi:hypothetical protein
MSEEITIAALAEVLHYDRASGKLLWKENVAKNVFVGTEAGCEKATRVSKSGEAVRYRYVRFRGINIPAARVVWAIVHGRWPNGRLKYKDGNPVNVAIENLIEQDSVAPRSNAAYLTEHRSLHPTAWKDGYLRRDYGISLADFARMVAAQNNRCAICGQEETVERKGELRTLAVDHDHVTGAVRQLVCQACNQGLGNFKDDPARLRAAADYIERHRKGGDNVVAMKPEAV